MGFIERPDRMNAGTIYSFPFLIEHGWACPRGIDSGARMIGDSDDPMEDALAKYFGRRTDLDDNRASAGVWLMRMGMAGEGSYFYGSGKLDGSGRGVEGYPTHGDARQVGAPDGTEQGKGCPFRKPRGSGRGVTEMYGENRAE